jgi:hypothetical protein
MTLPKEAPVTLKKGRAFNLASNGCRVMKPARVHVSLLMPDFQSAGHWPQKQQVQARSRSQYAQMLLRGHIQLRPHGPRP